MAYYDGFLVILALTAALHQVVEQSVTDRGGSTVAGRLGRPSLTARISRPREGIQS
jgi:hypothetical protein